MPSKNLLYLYTNKADRHIVCHGIDFRCFVGCLEKPLDNILLIKGDYTRGNYHSQSGFAYVSGSDIEKFAAGNSGRRGDFSWVDFEDEYELDQLTRLDIAELLFFGHRHQPFSSPVFTRLQNRFAYWSHDDGWYTSIYFSDSGDMPAFMTCAVASIASTKHLSLGKLQPETAKEIMSLSEGGLIIDAEDLSVNGDTVELPFFVTGKITDMADALKNTSQYKLGAAKKGTLRFKKKAEGQPPLTLLWKLARREKP